MSVDRLKGKVALVTGAAQGIGEEIAKFFVQEGAFVYLSDINDPLGKSVAEAIGKNAKYLHLDVTDESQWEATIKTITNEQKKLDILVNNSGVTGLQGEFGPQDPENASLECWRKVHAVNSDGVFLGCKHAIKVMKTNQNASIINISSRSGLVGIPDAAAYASSKAAIRNHTKSVALYCCKQGYSIRCNSIHPAAVLTPLWEPKLGKGSEREKNIKNLTKDIPMQRMGMPEDVAYAAVYFASDESKFITGTELIVDGGILAGSSASPGKKN